MDFIFSELTNCEKDTLISKYKLIHPYKKNNELYLHSQITNTNQDIRFLPLVGMILAPAVFVLIWKEKVCTLYLRYYTVKKDMRNISMKCIIEHIYADIALISKQNELIKLLDELIKGYFTLSAPWIKDVVCEYQEKINFVDCNGGMYVRIS